MPNTLAPPPSCGSGSQAQARGWGRMVGVERPSWPRCGAGPVHVSVPVAWRADKAWWPASHAVFVYSVICSDGAPQAAPQLSVGGGEPLEEGLGAEGRTAPSHTHQEHRPGVEKAGQGRWSQEEGSISSFNCCSEQCRGGQRWDTVLL